MPPFRWHTRLHYSAQELARWGWFNYLKGTADVSADGHWDFEGRIVRAGILPPDTYWGGKVSECGIGGTSDPTGDDGREYPRDPSNWCHPYYTPEHHAREAVDTLTEGITDPNEGHYKDFHSRRWTHAAIGYAGGIFVIDYGRFP